MERDDPTWNCSVFSGREDILSVNDSFDIEMTSVVDVLAHPSGDSAPVTGSEEEVPVAIPTLTRSLIPEMRTLHPGLTMGPVLTHPAVMMMTNSATCSVPEGPFNLSKGSLSPRHSPIATVGHENQNHTSEP